MSWKKTLSWACKGQRGSSQSAVGGSSHDAVGGWRENKRDKGKKPKVQKVGAKWSWIHMKSWLIKLFHYFCFSLTTCNDGF